MKRTVLAFLILVLLCCGCAKMQKTPEDPGTPILPDVVMAYDIDETKEAQIEDLFSDLSDAFETLTVKDSVNDDDFYDYAVNTQNLLNEFTDAFDWDAAKRNQDTASSDDKDKIALVEVQRGSLSLRNAELSGAILSKLIGSDSGEHCAEVAANTVNAYAQFFYGEDCITDDDMDRIAT